MTDISRDLRRALETTVKAARDAAELAAADALRRLGVLEQRRPEHLTEPRNAIRKRLRAHAKSLGDRLDAADGTALKRLTEAAAYVQWHRLLFARFLVERGLLRDEAGIVISLADCREEAAMAGAGDEWSVAAAHTTRLLPGVFPPDDPVESLVLAPEHAKALRDHLRRLDVAVFVADDSLGWTYQFWRAAEKKAVNDSQVRIGAAELPAVTQLFTEPYMVRFLLHNTLGAWWAGKVLSNNPELEREAADEAALRAACQLPGYEWEYLRFVYDDEAWRPAAGIFFGWPEHAAEITLLDPCCGSGHFLTEALAALAALRAAEEDLSPADAVVATLRDNLHGLEIDGRCVQIAAFALALTAWRIGGAETKLPVPHVAWVGAPPPLPKSEFAALANGDVDLRRGLEALHDLFAQAPLLGSLIEITGGDLVNPIRIARVEESIAALVEKMRNAEPERAEGALAARGMADAASILAQRFVLQTTNVPFLGEGRQAKDLADHIALKMPEAKAELAAAMIQRMRGLAVNKGVVATVAPQNLLYLKDYKPFRVMAITATSFAMIVGLGSGAFEAISGEVVNVALLIFRNTTPTAATQFFGIDANDAIGVSDKKEKLRTRGAEFNHQQQATHPNSAIILSARRNDLPLLSEFATVYEGAKTIDIERFRHYFWELDVIDRWKLHNSSPVKGVAYSGLHYVSVDRSPGGPMAGLVEKYESLGTKVVGWLCGKPVWGRTGVSVAWMKDLPAAIYSGSTYDNSAAVIMPHESEHLPAVFSFCTDPSYAVEVRKINRKMQVAARTLTQVPFDVVHWKKIAAETYPNGLPKTHFQRPHPMGFPRTSTLLGSWD